MTKAPPMADSAVKLTKRHWNVLHALGNVPGHVSQSRLPDGNGHSAGGYHASGRTMKELRDAGLVEYGRDEGQSYYGYRIAPAGRALLDALKEEGEDRG